MSNNKVDKALIARLDDYAQRCQRMLDGIRRDFEANRLSKLDYADRILTVNNLMEKLGYEMIEANQKLNRLHEVDIIHGILDNIERDNANVLKFVNEE